MSVSTLLRGVGFVTGSASGIGKATAYALARHGISQIVISDINAAAAESTAKQMKVDFDNKIETLSLGLDVTNEKEVDNTIEIIVKKFGRIDIAVNNAGIGGQVAPSAEHEYSEWKKTLDVDLNGVWLTSRAEIRQMLKQETVESESYKYPRGTIINIASMYGVVATSAAIPVVSYTAAKHAVVGLTKADALMYASKGIKINALCPGYVGTPLVKSTMPEDVIKTELAKIPMGRMAEMDEIADHVVMLASPLTSYMCGAALIADGGFTIQ